MIEGYKDLINSITLHKHLMEVAEINYNYNSKILNSWTPKEINAMQYSDMPKGSRNAKDAFNTITDLQKWQSQYQLEEDILNQLEERKKAIDECINKSDITVKVAQLRALGLTQEQVSELVDRSPRQIQNIERKIRSI